MPRRKRLDFRQVRPKPIVILAGLPHPIAGAAALFVGAHYSDSPKVIFASSGRDNNELYRPGTVNTLVSGLSAFAVRQRLSGSGSVEPLCLPPRNFFFRENRTLSEFFLSLRREEVPWAGSPAALQIAKATHEQLPFHVRNGAHKSFARDHRGLFFPPDKSCHGPARQLEPDCDHEDRKQFIRSVLRFGVRLSEGLHHEVQFGSGRSLGDTEFYCCQQGCIRLKSDYANVYPDDYVRPG